MTIRDNKKAIAVVVPYMLLSISVLVAITLVMITSTTTIISAQQTGSITSGGSTSNTDTTNMSATASTREETFTAQKTAVSNAGKLAIHQSHQVATVLPPRVDDKVWVGTITWAASKPIEVEMWHFYNSTIKADTSHGTPVLTPYSNGKTIAFTLLKPTSGTPLPSGSLNFAASELSFHTLDGSKFTVAYTVDAVAKKLNH
jgi:hypothetical protein